MQLDDVMSRFRQSVESVEFSPMVLVAVLIAAGVALWWMPAWRVLRIVVTLVHELGHAGVGLLFGQSFRGFVLNPDMSGHAVLADSRRGTFGVRRWCGSMASLWSGYPMPALVAAGFVWCVSKGWAAAAISGVLVVLLLSLPMVRSVFTALTTFLTAGAVAALWWWRDDQMQSLVLLSVSVFLLVGAWRHVVSVARSRDAKSDPGMMASLSGVPSVVWTASFVAAIGACSWYVATQLWHLSGF